jgi:methionyl-tRNA formyltransferase
MRIIFFGTPDFAVPSLLALLAGPDDVVTVVCQPDRPAGRGRHLTPPPVKLAALAANVPVLQPTKIRTEEFLDELRRARPDLIVVAAYGRILPAGILTLAPHGCINVHASLLPKYRGAAPMQWAILNGEDRTGITIMRVVEELDAGDILLQREVPIGPGDTLATIHDRLAALGAETLLEAIEALRRGALSAIPQDPAKVTFAPMIEKEDGRIDWRLTATDLERRVRAFHPWPSAYTFLQGKLLKVTRARATASLKADAPPGTVVALGEVVRVACGTGDLAVEELQLEGRRRLGAAEFIRGGHVAEGAVFG